MSVRAAPPDAAPMTSIRAARAYVRAGLRLARPHARAHAALAAVYATPAGVAALILALDGRHLDRDGLWLGVAAAALPWITAVLGTVAVMVMVSAHAHGRSISIGRATRAALPWVPRYLWTNAHTSVVFWTPMTVLLELRAWQAATLAVEGAIGTVVAACWWVVLAVVGVCLHTRTLLAPFLAVHADLPATLATLEAWRLTRGRNFAVCWWAFVLACLPVLVPVGALALAATVFAPPTVAAGLAAAVPALLWVVIQVIRPLLVPTIYVLYADFWHAEQAARAARGTPITPAWARALLALTRPLPRLGRPLGAAGTS